MASFRNLYLHKKNALPMKALAFACLFIFLLALLRFLSPQIKSVVYSFSSPVEQRFWLAGESSSGFLSSFLHAGSLRSENETLRQENQTLISQIIALQAIQNANQAQTDISMSAQNDSLALLMAGVVGLDGQGVLSLNKGSNDGVIEGMPVVNQQNILLGRVHEVYGNYSHVMLISNKKSAINVKVMNSQDPSKFTTAILKGAGDLQAYLDLVPVDSVILPNDFVASSSLEKVFPKDILIGTIGEVEKNDQKPFQQATVNPLFNLQSIDTVFVVTNYK